MPFSKPREIPPSARDEGRGARLLHGMFRNGRFERTPARRDAGVPGKRPVRRSRSRHRAVDPTGTAPRSQIPLCHRARPTRLRRCPRVAVCFSERWIFSMQKLAGAERTRPLVAREVKKFFQARQRSPVRTDYPHELGIPGAAARRSRNWPFRRSSLVRVDFRNSREKRLLDASRWRTTSSAMQPRC